MSGFSRRKLSAGRHHRPPRQLGRKILALLAACALLVTSLLAGMPTANAADNSITVEVTKTDTNGTPLAGATFQLVTFLNFVEGSCTTNYTGTCTIASFTSTSHALEETSAPPGYVLDQTLRSVRLSRTPGEVVPVTVRDVPVAGRVSATVRVFKKDSLNNQPLGGATFELRRDAANGIAYGQCTTALTVVDPGSCEVDNITIGSYFWVETTAPTGYDLADPVPVSVTAADDAQVVASTVQDTTTVTGGTITVTKRDAVTRQPLAGAGFEVTLPPNFTKLSSCTTGTEGTCDLAVTGPGDYPFSEVKAPDGYVLPTGNDAKQQVTVDDTTKTATVEFLDSRIKPASLTLRVGKADRAGKPLSGAKFDLLDAGGMVIASCTIVDGFCSFPGLALGQYTLVETQAPAGYQLPVAPDNRTEVNLDGTIFDENDVFDVSIANQSKVGTLTIKKVDTQTGLPLPGVILTVSGPTIEGTENCLTDIDGKCTIQADTVVGTYTVHESTPPNGYLVAPDLKAVIDPSNAGTNATFTMRDSEVLSQLSVTKQDLAGNPLTGATFDLLKDGTKFGSCDTAATSTCTVSDLPWGTYVWHETKAPDGYDLAPDSAAITINIVNAGSILPVTIVKDAPTPTTSLTVHKADAGNLSSLTGATFQLHRSSASGAVVGTCTTTGSEGSCVIDTVTPGTYVWVETVAPTGYQLAPPSDVVTVDASGQAEGDTQLTIVTDLPLHTVLTVRKQDANIETPLNGATFRLDRVDTIPRTTVGTCTTASTTAGNGQCSVTVSSFGQYQWVETGAPLGYLLPSPPSTSPTITITTGSAGTAVNTIMTDTQKTTTLSVQKSDADTGLAVDGATFELRTLGSPPIVIGQCTTGGQTHTCSVSVPFGTYIWVETAAPTGYVLPAPAPTSGQVVVDASNAGTTIPAAVVSDHQKLTSLTVSKVDAGNQPLSGATFTLLRRDGVSTTIVGSCAMPTTTSCTIDNLGFGTYFWRESVAPTGYQKAADTADIVLNAANAGGAGFPTEVRDVFIPTLVTVHKTDASGRPLAGATFAIYFDSINLAGSCVSATNGDCQFPPIPPGPYVVHEMAAPRGYQESLDDPAVIIDLAHAGDPVTVTVRDDQMLTSLRIEKFDADTESLLAGADFDLRRTDVNGDVVAHCVTGSNGRCTVDGIAFGTYVWVETKAPAGYILRSGARGPIVVDASNAGQALPVTRVSNSRTTSTLTILKTDITTDVPLAGATFGLFRESNEQPGLQRDTDTKIDECTTDTSGHCSIDGLTNGVYYWLELVPPTNYVVSTVPTAPIPITPENAGTTLATAKISDHTVTVPAVDIPTPKSPQPSPTPRADHPRSSGPELASTGANASIGATVALLVLAAGVALTLAGRRRLDH